jgi:hypothetical protein
MNIAIATGSSQEYMSLQDATLPSKKAYAEKWNMTLETRIFSGDNIAWDRVGMVRDLLPRYDVVIWMDSDAFVANQDFDIKKYLEMGYGEEDREYTHNFMISTDLNSINTGVFIARNTPWVREFLYVVMHEGYLLFNSHMRKEQQAIRDYMENHPYKGLVSVMPQNFMNSFIMKEYETERHDFKGNYKPGDWMIHMPGLPNQRRIEIVKEILG